MTDEALRKIAEQAAVRGLTVPLRAERVLDLLDRVETAEQALQRVRELHRECDFYRETCVECSIGDNLVDWPCPTIRALRGDDA